MVEKKSTKKTATKKAAQKKTTKKTTTKTTRKTSPKSTSKARTTTRAKTATQNIQVMQKSNEGFKWAVLILLVANFIASIMIMHNNPTKEIVLEAINEIEAQKVGGEKNYQILTDIYESENFAKQQNQSLESTRQRINGQATTQPSGETTTTNTPQKISSAQVSEVTSNIYAKGNTEAKFVLLEYSDYLCPFCQRQHSQGIVNEVLANFEGEISVAFMPNTRGNPTSLEISNATECAGEQGKFNEYVDGMFAAGPSQANIVTVATSLGLDMNQFNSCVENNTYDQKIADSMANGQSLFGVRGTPGNVILNKETGEYYLIAGAYPYTEFEKRINELMSR